MIIKTGYFAYIKKYKKLGYTTISIARWVPKWYDGERYPELAPSNFLLSKYKNNLITEEDFKIEYIKGLNRNVVENFINSISEKYDRVILLCYEKCGDFCHRHILADYIKQEFNIDVEELVIKKEV